MIIPEIKITLSFDKKIKKSELIKITQAKDAYEVFKEIFNKDTFDWIEEIIILCLNKANKVVGFYKVSSGGISGTVCDPKVVFTIALNCGATGIILAHNHPSGLLKPSEADIRLTNKIKEGATILEMVLIDHLILNDEKFYSFAEEGLL